MIVGRIIDWLISFGSSIAMPFIIHNVNIL